MNAHLIQSFVDVLTAPETSARVGKQRLDDACTIYRNRDDYSCDKALDAFTEGRAAYWSMVTYHNQRGCRLLDALNGGFTIAQAIHAHWSRSDEAPLDALDALVPLNAKACTALSLAYAAEATWKDEDELEMRAKRDMSKRRAA